MKRFIAISAALLLVSCGWAEWPPRGYKSGSTGGYSKTKAQSGAGYRASNRAPTQMAPVRGGGHVRVARGESVYALSRRHGVSMRAIIIANNLQPPYTLSVGQRLAIPAVREHRVQQGETLNMVAHHYGLSIYELARNNRLRAPYRIHQGQTLIIAQANTSPNTSPQFTRQPAASHKTSRPPQAPRAPVKQTVESTVKPVSKPAPLPKSELASKSKSKTYVKPLRTVSVKRFRRVRGFIWPLRGRLISGFGPKAKGLHNDGVNISAPRGAPVRAAEGGTVAYSGNELRGFGNLLLIKHSNGWVTAYAHNGKLLVKRGDRVGKGDIIARVGSTGAVTRPQLHFEIRRGKRPLNPQKYLRKAPTSS